MTFARSFWAATGSSTGSILPGSTSSPFSKDTGYFPLRSFSRTRKSRCATRGLPQRSPPPEPPLQVRIGHLEHDRPAVGTGVGLLGGEQLGDQGFHFGGGERVVHLHRRLAGHAGGERFEELAG